jgi:hypothetical protein
MNRLSCLTLAALSACGTALAQSNERGPGYDASLTDIYGVTDWGRRGPAYPGGEVGISIANQLCNPGTQRIEWRSPGGSVGATIQNDHPKFGFLVAREMDGRFVQISDWSYCKHAFYALASPSTCGGTCQPPPVAGTQLGINCSDIYSASNNGSRTYLGPPAEINPWLGTWNGVGSYFDIGHPGQAGYPLPADGLRSLSTSGFDAVQNRVTIREADIVNGATMFFQVHVVIEGERVENRANNIMSRPFAMTYVGGTGQSAWASSTLGTPTLDTILTRWPGATVTWGSNGGTGTLTDDDGRFYVAVKVSGPVNGLWHYEYVVQNLDNHRGGASFRLPVCSSARVTNLGFRDIDQNVLNDWTATVQNGEIAWTAPASNPQNWNTLYNFSFDCDVAPSSGNATIDQARIGPGTLAVTVPTTVPGLQPAVYLGAGCGTPAAELFVNGVPSAGNSNFAVEIAGAPGLPVLLYFSDNAGNTAFGPCTVHLDLFQFGTVGFYTLDGAGLGSVPIPVQAGQVPVDLVFQGATFVANPPLLGLVGLTNGLKVRFANTGCD